MTTRLVRFGRVPTEVQEVETRWPAVASYLSSVMASFVAPPGPAPRINHPGATIEQGIFSTLTSRAFSYLGREKSLPYRDHVIPTLQRDIASSRPARFFFDLGPGYHASLQPGVSDLVFDVGLAELLALRQIVLFDSEVRRYYAPGVRFSLVIDNLCGFFTNDVPIDCSARYVAQLRSLITDLGVGDRIDVLVESERFTTARYERPLARVASRPSLACQSEADRENVSRFLGRPCSKSEAIEREERYRRTSLTTEELLSTVIDGVRLTQRATQSTLAFRSFPGGARRIQVGEIVISMDESEGIRPLLLTSRNFSRYAISRVSAANILPPTLGYVSCVHPLPGAASHDRKE